MKTSHTLAFLCFLLLRTTSGSVSPPNCRLQKNLSSDKQGESGNYVACDSNVENQDLGSSSSSLEKKDDSSDEIDEDVTWLLANPQRDLLLYGNQADAETGDFGGSSGSTDDDVSFERNNRAGGHQFLRFGRNMNHNFMRFGRSGHFPTSTSPSSVSSSTPSLPVYLRVGRSNSPAHQFMRIGRSISKMTTLRPFERSLDLDSTEMSYLPDEVSHEMISSEMEDDLYDRPFRSMNHNFLRFGRKGTGLDFARSGRTASSHNFMRFGRIPEHKFMRFGRSRDHLQESSTVANKKSKRNSVNSSVGHVFFRFGRK